MVSLGNTFGTAAPDLMQSLLQAEVQLAAMGLMVLMLDRYLVKVDQNFRYLLWLTVLVKALWPPMLTIPALDVWPTQILTIGLVSPAAEAAQMGLSGTTSMTLAATVSLVIWIGLSSLLLLLISVQSWSLRYRLAAESMLWEDDDPETFPRQEWPPIRVSSAIPSPMTVGLLRPRIYLTPKITAGSHSNLTAILHHEMAHVLRRDNWVVLLYALAVILHPFNPLVWIMGHRLSRYREQACDAYAVEQTAIDPQLYGHMLINQVTTKSRVLPTWQTAACFTESKVDLRQRLGSLMLLKEPLMKHSTVILRTLLGSAVFVMVLLSSQCQTGEADKTLLSTQPVAPSTQAIAGQPKAVINDDGSVTITSGNQEFLFKDNTLIFSDGSILPLAEGDKIGLPDGTQVALSDGKISVSGGSSIKFVPYDKAPVPLGGYKAIQKAVVYPQADREAGNEGTVIVQIFIDETGEVTQTIVLSGVPDTGLDAAAIAALETVTFVPAQQKGENVGVWISIPVNFKLAVE